MRGRPERARPARAGSGIGGPRASLTRMADSVIHIQNDTQFAQLKALAVSQIDLHG